MVYGVSPVEHNRNICTAARDRGKEYMCNFGISALVRDTIQF